MIEVLAPGLLTTVQDRGRFGHGRLGVSPGGAADGLALRVANRLVGNDEGTAALEMTLLGPRLRFAKSTTIALAGADFAPRLDGVSVPLHRALEVPAGGELAFGGGPRGARLYLAVAGGIVVPDVLGSASTDLRGGFGGVDGRALRAGDELETGRRQDASRRCGPPPAGLLERASLLRVARGVHGELFADRAHDLLVTREFTVRNDSDRMGVRLEGPGLELAAPRELVSEGVAPGAIQVPPDGAPIILGVDHPSTGGYPQIAHVIAADLPALAQLRPHQRIRFVRVDLDQALHALRSQSHTLLEWGQVLQ